MQRSLIHSPGSFGLGLLRLGGAAERLARYRVVRGQAALAWVLRTSAGLARIDPRSGGRGTELSWASGFGAELSALGAADIHAWASRPILSDQ